MSFSIRQNCQNCPVITNTTPIFAHNQLFEVQITAIPPTLAKQLDYFTYTCPNGAHGGLLFRLLLAIISCLASFCERPASHPIASHACLTKFSNTAKTRLRQKTIEGAKSRVDSAKNESTALEQWLPAGEDGVICSITKTQ